MRTFSNAIMGGLLTLLIVSMTQADNPTWITLSGSLWLDSNSNGQVDPNELPLPNWTLQADHLYQTQTNADGTYSLTVPAGSEHRLLAFWPDRWQQTYPTQTMEYRYGGTQVLSPANNGSAEVEALSADNKGNHYLAGSFSGTVDFDPGVREDLQTDQNGRTFLTKINADQSYAWTVILPGVGDGPTDITVTSDQNILVVGQKIHNTQGYVACIDPQGIQIWIDTFTNIFPYGICTAPDQSLYVTGNFKGSVDFDPNQQTTATRQAKNYSYEVFLLHLTDAGEFVEVETMGHSTDLLARGQRVRTDSYGNVYICGYSNNLQIDFDPGPGQDLYHSNGDKDSFVSRYNADGSYAWTFHISSSFTNQPLDMAIDALDRLVVVGTYNGGATFGTGGPYIISSKGVAEAFALQLDPNGALLWLKALNSSSVEADMSLYDAAATGVSVDSLNYIHVVGERVPDNELFRYEEFYGGQNDLFIWDLTETGENQGFECLNGLSETPSQGSQGYYVPLTWDVTVDALGDVIVGGRFSYTADLAPGVPQDTFTPKGQTDAFVTTLERLHGTYLVDPSSGSQAGLDFGFLNLDPNGTGSDAPSVTEPNSPPIDVIPI